MTDGPTGFHVAPITEDDMNRVTSILKRATDAILGMSQLAADVQMLRDTVSGLQADTDRLRSQNNALDEALNYSRGERDRQATELTNTKAQLTEVLTNFAATSETINTYELQISQAQIDLDLTRRERDDAQFKSMELEEKLATAVARINQANKLISDMVSLFKPDEPKPIPNTEFVPVELHSEVKQAGTDMPNPPHEASAPEPDSLTAWEPGYTWDHSTQKYWRAGVTPKHDGEAIPF